MSDEMKPGSVIFKPSPTLKDSLMFAGSYFEDCIEIGGVRYWAIAVPTLNLHTQGASKENAFFKLTDAFKDLSNFAGIPQILDNNKGEFMFIPPHGTSFQTLWRGKLAYESLEDGC